MEKITIKDIRDAIKSMKKANECENCHTGKEDYLVAGYVTLCCKCKAERRSKTKIAKAAQEALKGILNYKPIKHKDGSIGEFEGIKIFTTSLMENKEVEKDE